MNLKWRAKDCTFFQEMFRVFLAPACDHRYQFFKTFSLFYSSAISKSERDNIDRISRRSKTRSLPSSWYQAFDELLRFYRSLSVLTFQTILFLSQRQQIGKFSGLSAIPKMSQTNRRIIFIECSKKYIKAGKYWNIHSSSKTNRIENH